MKLPESKFHIAPFGYFFCIVAGALYSRKQAAHFFFAFEIKLIVWKLHSIRIIDCRESLYAQKHVLRLCVLLIDIMHVICGNHRKLQLL